MDDERVDKILQRGEMIFEFLGGVCNYPANT